MRHKGRLRSRDKAIEVDYSMTGKVLVLDMERCIRFYVQKRVVTILVRSNAARGTSTSSC